MDDKFSALESDNGGRDGEHIRDKGQRIASESEDSGIAGRDTVKRPIDPKEAHELALHENITIAEAYSRLLGVECGIGEEDEK